MGVFFGGGIRFNPSTTEPSRLRLSLFMEHPIFRVVRTTVCSLQPVLLSHSHGTVAQRLEQGTHNPFHSQQNTAPDAHPQQIQQQSFQKTPVSEVDSTTNQLASLSSLVHIHESLSSKGQETLYQFALSLYRAEVNQ